MTSIISQLGEALWLLVLGMGLVYLFLGLLILGIHWVARFYGPEAKPQPVPPAARPAIPQGLDPKVLEAIRIAIFQHRTREGQNQ
ncbi:OadG family transporter subunit [Shewanella cyperi]|uniref:OadG family transporter subunit n=1 Tax=Shewanella cyperi TaxID=2814292 RepID=UPI001A94BA0C|nr:OadG family transporter subunit [Shewanella cyperi]QSX39833.1 OadG family protein [Shewanella cyperi]